MIDELVHRAQAEGLQLAGEGGLLQQLTKRLMESALEGEITDHLGYDTRHQKAADVSRVLCDRNMPVDVLAATTATEAPSRGGASARGKGKPLYEGFCPFD